MTRKEFEDLTKEWLHETCIISSSTQIVEHAISQQFIEEGEVLLPWIIEEYRKGPWVGWDLVLQRITGTCPYGRADRGYVYKNRSSWVKWWNECLGEPFGGESMFDKKLMDDLSEVTGQEVDEEWMIRCRKELGLEKHPEKFLSVMRSHVRIQRGDTDDFVTLEELREEFDKPE